MSTTTSIRRSATVCALGVAALVPAGGGVAFADSQPLAQEAYYSSYSTPAVNSDLAQEQYFSSYGDPQALTQPTAPGAPGDDVPWLPITLSVAGTLALAGAGATQVRRVRIRRGRVAAAGS